MSRFSVSADHCHLMKDDKPFFWLADTIWSAFTNLTLEEWAYYLKLRKEQGFTVLQINTLAQWDRGESTLNWNPFELKEDGIPDYARPRDDYFEHAREMCRMAKEAGLDLALVVVWCNQVPGTWANGMLPAFKIPKDLLPGIVNRIYDSFDEFDPIYVISGDTDFPTEETCEYYQVAFDLLRERNFTGLKTMHIKGRFTDIPDQFADQMDFYLYQSGHNAGAQAMAYTSAKVLSEREPKRPVINSEPCYEQMGYSHMLYGRFTQKDVRRAAWQSLLSGACAGITYGAHGVWNWVSANLRPCLMLGEGFDAPKPHNEAVQFPGAWDYGFMHTFFEEQKLATLINCNELILNKTEEIRMAKASDADKYIIFAPVNTKILIDKDLSDKRVRAIDLTGRRTAHLTPVLTEEGKTQIPMHPFSDDVVIVIG